MVQAMQTGVLAKAVGGWKVLVVEDDDELAATAHELLAPITFQERAVVLLRAATIAEAKRVLADDDDIAMGLFSVEMGGDEWAGVELARYLRETLGNYATRVVLGSNQPNWALEERVVIDCDINDYRSKSELLSPRLFPVVIAALRGYARMVQCVDGLTGMGEDGHKRMREDFIVQAEREMARAGRYGTSLAFLFIDVDDFEALNRRYGREAGDMVLRRLSGLMGSHFRSSDTMSRLRSDKFVAMLPAIEVAEAVMVAERLRLLAEGLRFEEYPELRVTLSIGVSLYAEGDNVETVIARADTAMHGAKADGRNWVVALTDGGDIALDW